MHDHDPRASVAAASAASPATRTQHKRRTLFATLLGLVLLPTLVAAVLPNAQAEEPVYVAADVAPAPTSSESTTTASTAAPTTSTTAPPTTAAPSTTARPKASTTTTTAQPRPTTTTTPPTTAAPKAPAAAPPAPAPTAAPASSGSGATAAEAAFLACIRQRESGGNYGVVSSNGLWFGAYQMTRQTWNSAAQRAGRGDLVGVPPNQASPSDQDRLALVLYRWLGKSPWGGAC